MELFSNFKQIQWSGGTSTELYIYPPQASFAQREFNYRLSIATLNDEHSVFTSLPAVNRTLMLLSGALELHHQEHHHKTLLPFDQDTFLGDWHTESFGTGSDFNLMTKADTQGTLKSLHLLTDESMLMPQMAENKQHFLYCYKGQFQAQSSNQVLRVKANELLLIGKEAIEIMAQKPSDLVYVVLTL